MSLRRSVASTLVVLGLVTAGTVGLAGPAAAHHALTGSDPADGATVDDPPTSISLTFDQPVQGSDVFQTLAAVTTAAAAMIIRDMRTDLTFGRTAAPGGTDPGPGGADDGSPTR